MFLCFLGLYMMIGNVNAQQRTKLSDGVYVVDYAGTWVVENDNTGQSISIEVKQEYADARNNEMMYKVVCGKWTRRVIKSGLKKAIKEGIKAAGVTEGFSLTVSVIAFAADVIYDEACDYWERKNNERRYNNND